MRALAPLFISLLCACASSPTASVDASRGDATDVDVVRIGADGASDSADAFADAPQALIDDRFTRRQWEVLQRFSPVPGAPPNPTNRWADDPRAAELGRALFADRGFSRGGDVA